MPDDGAREAEGDTIPMRFGYTGLPIATLDDLGGEQAIINLDPAAAAQGIELLAPALSLCANWSHLHDRGAAAAWLRAAITHLDGEELIDFNDVVLSSPDALQDLSGMLARAWQDASGDPGMRGSVALEGWTRLAIGSWSSRTPLEGALYGRAAAAPDGVEPDVYLVRSLGAALDQWSNDELEAALESLVTFDGVEGNAAFELGMAELRRAVHSDDPGTAAQRLRVAHTRFAQANDAADVPRPDAQAFADASTAVADFLDRVPVASTVVAQIETAARNWQLGYRNEAPHWRQPRAETAIAWSALVRDLIALGDLDDDNTWYDYDSLIATIGHVYTAYNSSNLLARTGPTGTDVAALALGPALDAALGANAERVKFVDRWLADTHRDLAQTDAASATLDAIQSARNRLDDPGVMRGKHHASPGTPGSDTLREAMRILLGDAAFDDLVAMADDIAKAGLDFTFDDLPGAMQGQALDEDLLLRKLMAQIEKISPEETEIWKPHLRTLIDVLIRIVKVTIDQVQHGERRLPWHTDSDEPRQREHLLADYLCAGIRLVTRWAASTEVTNVAGGRVDVSIPIDNQRFVIEVKREPNDRSDDELSAAYGAQAVEYTVTGPPFGFLAVLDLVPRESRLSTADSFWVRPVDDHAARRVVPLTGLRVLAKANTPSTLSR